MKLNHKSHSLLKMYDIILYLMALSFYPFVRFDVYRNN